MTKIKNELKEALLTVLQIPAGAYADVSGSTTFPDIKGFVYFYSLWGGTLVIADVNGLPHESGDCKERIFGIHIHEGSSCTGNAKDSFANTGSHYNPNNCLHPQHAGDLPPLFGNDGYAFTAFYTSRFQPEELVGHTVVLHDMPDDFHSQPSGDSGLKIACGLIKIG